MTRLMTLRKFNPARLIEIALLFVVSALAYLPGLLQATVYRDDWYYVLDRLIGGPGVFQAMFSIDRPARGPFFEAYYQAFGVAPLPYHLSSFLWRFLGGLAALWLFNLLWLKQRRATLFIALLFVLFPGYLRWLEGFENQPRIASSCLEALSFALTLKAISANRTFPRIAAWAGSIITGWAYLALVDFSIGMEIFRLLCIYVFVNQGQSHGSLLQRWGVALRAWAAAVLIPAGFLFWRLFIFHNERPQTDIGRQLGVLWSSPLATAFIWLIRLFQSAADVSFLSWGTPALQDFFGLRLRDMLLGLFMAFMAVASVYLANWFLNKEKAGSDGGPDGDRHDPWTMQAIWMGLAGVVIGVLPVIMANRYVDFRSYSHYALPASLAAAVLAVGVVSSLSSSRMGLYFVLALVASAVLTHAAYSTQVVAEEKSISEFWHQLAWRAPEMRRETTLFVNYAGFSYGDDIDAVDGPANFIYFPGPTNHIPVTYQIYALPQLNYTTNDVRLGKDKSGGYRTHIANIEFERFLVISQPSAAACVHAIDSKWPLFSSDDPDQVLLVGQYSKVDSIIASSNSPRLAAFMFGPEPVHQWCYYFEKAELALQSEDWEKVAELGNMASKADLHPEDQVEWTPFLQAYAYLDDVPLFTATAHRINSAPFAKLQACNILTHMQEQGYSLSSAIQTQTSNLLCKGE